MLFTTAIDNIDSPLSIAIDYDKTKVKSLYDSLGELKSIFSTELRSTLGIVITTTDNDGD